MTVNRCAKKCANAPPHLLARVIARRLDCFGYDAKIEGRANGAFTYYALTTLKTINPGASYAAWVGASPPSCLPAVSYP